MEIRKNLFFIFFFIFVLKCSYSHPCREITVAPYESNKIYIKKNTTNCVLFPFENKIEGNIILKLARSNSFTSVIYIYENKSQIEFNSSSNEFINYYQRFQLGEEFYKEKIIENMKAKEYYFIIYEPYFNFIDELIIYNDKFAEKNYFQIKNIKINDIRELNFKNDYNEDNPIIIHFNSHTKNLKYLSYQVVPKNSNEILSLYVYKNFVDNANIIETLENTRGNSNYVELESNKDYYIKIIMKGEIDLVLKFLESKILKIDPDDIYTEQIISTSDFYYYMEKELIFENDEYFNEFTIKLDSTNYKNLPFEIITSTCEKSSEEELLICLSQGETGQKSVIKRDIDIPYIYHIYYSFNLKDYLAIKISNKNNLPNKQRFIIESSGGNDLIDEKFDKLFANNKGYLYPVYLNISINDINNEFNNNKNRILFINTNTSSALKIFFNDNSFKDNSLEFNKKDYIPIDNFVYGLDFNDREVQNLFGRRKYFTIVIYCPWESSPITFQLTFVNNNINNFKYIINDQRPITSMKINLNSPKDKYYFIGQYNSFSTNILYNELVYGKIKADYKYFSMDQKISSILYNETAPGYTFDNWTPVRSMIDIIEISCLSPALLYMNFIDDQAININNIILEKGSQNYIFLNNTNYYKISLDKNLKGSKNINIEVFLVSQVEKQAIDIIINENEYTLNKTEQNTFLRINTKDDNFENFGIRGRGTATLLRVKISSEEKNQKIAYSLKYEKDSQKNIISRYKTVKIKNNNSQNVNLCYTFNFVENDLLYNPKSENCFELKAKTQTEIYMYNPWNKYLDNKNNLFDKSDSYYLIIYTEDENSISNLEFSSKEETIKLNLDIKENEFLSISKSQNYLVKSSDKENQMILVQFSPIININNNINVQNDEFGIISQFDNPILKGKIYPKINRTFVLFDDPLIDSFISLDLKQEMQYEFKYSYISNKNNFKKDRITYNYTIDLNKENDAYKVKFKPLFKSKNIVYNIFIFYNDIKDNISPTYLNLLSKNNNNKDSVSVIKKEMNAKEDIIEISLDNNDIDRIKKEKCYITVLAEENEIYNIIMNYDIFINTPEEVKSGKGPGLLIGIIFGCLLVIALTVVLGYFAYKFLLKKKVKSEEELIKGIDSVNVKFGEDDKSQLNNDEGI